MEKIEPKNVKATEAVKLEEINKLYDSSEKVAKEIRMLSRAIRKMVNDGNLKRETIVLLLHTFSGVGKPDVRAVLFALDKMESEYCK